MERNVQTVRDLRFFNKKADDLLDSPFFQTVLEGSTRMVPEQTPEGSPYLERRGPVEVEIKAFVLDLRFFIQDNERSSLRNMAGTYPKRWMFTFWV